MSAVTRSSGSIPRGNHDDSGAPIAELLGVRYHPLQTSAWRSEPLAAVPFLAALASGGSSVLYKGAESLVGGKVVFTGYHGDKVWGTKPTDPGCELVRTDTAGVDLTEYRLWAGFVHCPVPFLGVRQLRDVHRISTSEELAPWNAATDYNRPICRRIVEEQGVPREMFARRKKATAQPLLRAEDYLTRDMRSDYYRWVRAQRHVWKGLRMEHPSVLVDMRFIGRARAAKLVEHARRHAAVKRLGARVDGVLAQLLDCARAEAGRGPPPVRVPLGRRPRQGALRRPASVGPGRMSGTAGSRKIFCIGLNKTGTISLHHALTTLGFSSLHWGGQASRLAVERAIREDKPLLEYLGEYDAYSDIQRLSVNFELLDRQYPASGSSSPLATSNSGSTVVAGTCCATASGRSRASTTARSSRSNPTAARAVRRSPSSASRSTSAIAKTSSSCRVTDGDGYEVLCPFLGVATSTKPFPWSHKNTSISP